MVVASGTEFMFTADQETNPLPLIAIVAGSTAELIVVGDTELSCGNGVSPVHFMLLPQVVMHETAITTATTTKMRPAFRDVA